MRNKLRTARINRNRTQKDVATFLGVTERAYSYWESGERGISDDNWLKLFEYFDREIPLHELMEKTQRKES